MLELCEAGGVCFLRSNFIKSAHGFSTRLGGVSTNEHTRSLNLAFGRGDTDGEVSENVRRFAAALGISADRIISVPQVHSGEVRIVGSRDAGAGISRTAEFSSDGYATAESGLPIGVKTADCVPILLEARDAFDEVIAVAAVHAGWRGTAERIAAAAVARLCELGGEVSGIYAVIGPCIDGCCYEVKDDFTDKIEEKLGLFYRNRFIETTPDGRLFASLKGMNSAILCEAGVLPEHIDVCERCTCCDGELFYSHRRQAGQRGAHLNVICK